MAGGTDTGNPLRGLVGVGLEKGNQTLQIVGRQALSSGDRSGSLPI
jgi:hypothetical protein